MRARSRSRSPPSWLTYKPETRFIHSGQPHDSRTGAVTVPISLATTFAQHSPGVTYSGFEYSRTNNPTRAAFEKCIAESESCRFGLAFASGCATTLSILSIYKTGDHIVAGDDLYGGSRRLFTRFHQQNQGLEFTFVDPSNSENIAQAIKENTKLVWVETPTNPMLKLVDIEAVARICNEKGVKLVVDSTFCSPFIQRPVELGASAVMHSCTKYVNGHSDVVMGVFCTNDEEWYNQIKFYQNTIGAIPSPFDCYQAMRGMKTLHLRMKAHSDNAMAVAQLLEQHPKVEKVVYPGLPSHPQHDLAKRQMHMFSGMITFYLKGGLQQARDFLENTRVFVCAESLGAVECLMEHPAIMTHASVPPEVRAELGISDSMIRLSIGVEHIDDILGDINRALDAVTSFS